MSVVNWIVLFLLIWAVVARSFCYFGMSRNVDTGQEVDSAASMEDERALSEAWARRVSSAD